MTAGASPAGSLAVLAQIMFQGGSERGSPYGPGGIAAGWIVWRAVSNVWRSCLDKLSRLLSGEVVWSVCMARLLVSWSRRESG